MGARRGRPPLPRPGWSRCRRQLALAADDNGITRRNRWEWEPRDTQGFLRRLRAAAPALDPLAVRYVEEALRAFTARCYLASSVMLGVASERAFTGLAEAFVRARPEAAGPLPSCSIIRGPLCGALPRVSQAPRTTAVNVAARPCRRVDPGRCRGPAPRDPQRAARHPTGQDIDEDTARAHLQMAAVYLRKMTELRLRFETDAAS